MDWTSSLAPLNIWCQIRRAERRAAMRSHARRPRFVGLDAADAAAGKPRFGEGLPTPRSKAGSRPPNHARCSHRGSGCHELVADREGALCRKVWARAWQIRRQRHTSARTAGGWCPCRRRRCWRSCRLFGGEDLIVLVELRHQRACRCGMRRSYSVLAMRACNCGRHRSGRRQGFIVRNPERWSGWRAHGAREWRLA